ncbi:MAG: hypothetical protein ACRC14_06385, partial [Paracoccaceae bacterium]
DPPPRALQWERMSAALGLGLPLIGFVWAWGRFCAKGQVWVKATGIEVSRWYPTPECPLAFPPDIGLCRYGNIANRNTAGLNGVDFLPFWQPAVMIILSTAVLAVTLVVLYRLSRRLPVRQRAINEPVR